MTKKDLKLLCDTGAATDITNYSYEKVTELEEKEGRLDWIALTKGTYGMSGGLFQAFDSNRLYVILSRNSLLLRLA